jgi:hypothetical protein
MSLTRALPPLGVISLGPKRVIPRLAETVRMAKESFADAGKEAATRAPPGLSGPTATPSPQVPKPTTASVPKEGGDVPKN